MSSTPTAITKASPMLIVGVLCFGSLSCALMQTLVIPIQAELPELLHTDAATASWAVTATLLAAAVTMPVSGRLADLYGKKRVLVASAIILMLGSLVAALASTVAPFLVGRVLQGVAMGYVPVAISMVREIAPRERAAGAVAAVSATLGVGGAIGLPLSAWIAEYYSWHGLFWLSAGLAGAVALVTALVVPNVPDRHPGRIDVVGAIGLAIGLSAVLIGVSKGSVWGWSSAETIGSIVAGVLVLLVWGVHQLRHKDPLVDLRTTASKPVLFTNLSALLIGFGMMAQSIVVPQLLEMPEATGFGLDQTILQAGLWMAPGGLMMMLFAPVSSGLINSVGARITLTTGALVITVGYIAALGLMDAPWQLMIASLIASAGVGIGYAAMPTLILDNVPESEAGSSVGVNGLMRSVGTTIAGAVMAAIMTSQTIQFGDGVIPSQRAFELCFIVGAAAALGGALLALVIPSSAAKKTAPSMAIPPSTANAEA